MPPDPSAFSVTAAQNAQKDKGRDITLPSPLPSGDAKVDTIQLKYYRTQKVSENVPVILVLPPIGSDNDSPRMRRIARYLNDNGVDAVLVTLPYHGKRKGGGTTTLGAFVGFDPEKNARAFQQSASDVSAVIDYLESDPRINKRRIAIAGFSLGAIITHLVQGQDERISAGVAIVGSGDLPDLYHNSLLAKVYRLFNRPPANYHSRSPFRALSPADPLTFAGENRPRRVLMVQAARDNVILPRDATELWIALGRPPIRWTDTNHVATGLGEKTLQRAALFYIQGVWDNKTDKELDATLPKVSAPLFKGGFLAQFGDRAQLGFTPAVSYQFASLGTARTHTSVLFADVGLSGRGPFVGAGVTANAYLDVGFASRFTGKFAPPRPYLSLHLAY